MHYGTKNCAHLFSTHLGDLHFLVMIMTFTDINECEGTMVAAVKSVAMLLAHLSVAVTVDFNLLRMIAVTTMS